MNKLCAACNNIVVKVWIQAGNGTLIVEQSTKGGSFARRPSSGVDAYVCPKCGLVELFAKNPSIFIFES